jgi:hypothetical protein
VDGLEGLDHILGSSKPLKINSVTKPMEVAPPTKRKAEVGGWRFEAQIPNPVFPLSFAKTSPIKTSSIMSNEGFSCDGFQHFPEFASPQSSFPTASDDHVNLDLSPLSGGAFAESVDFFADLPELQTNIPAFENTASVNLDQIYFQEGPPPDTRFNAQAAIADVQRDIHELRRQLFHVEARLNVQDCVLPPLQQE